MPLFQRHQTPKLPLHTLPAKQPIGWMLLVLLSGGIGYWWIGYEIDRTQSKTLILVYGSLFLVYGLVATRSWDAAQTRWWMGIAVLLRLVFLFSTPVLSDDFFRFVWDGRLLVAGVNPYLYLPSNLLHSPIFLSANLNTTLYEGLNSPNYFTVYPSLNQLFFGIAAWIGGDNVQLSVVVMRVIILMAEVGNCWLLSSPQNLGIQPSAKRKINGLAYALNPLVIVELTGNLHFEAVTLFFVLLALRWLNRPWFKDSYLTASAMALGLGASVKLLPLIFLPLLVRRIGWQKGIIYGGVVGATMVGLFLPFLSKSLFTNVGASLDLYFQKFEFNASVYYLLREVGYWITGYNLIQSLGPILSLITLGTVSWLAFQKRSLAEKMLLSLTVYFFLATTVHPWYITTLVALGAVTRHWYPVIWSLMLPLTYVAYASSPYHENLRVVGLEYILVFGLFAYEVLLKGIDWETN
ncbi:glycosyltransferase 87 family protein [Runella limosa]|uniref:glycosyltransferase 87 family protein n=1 Tax=Runella limosa TaxID=370978 RepID=UPI0004097DC7|nr:glycosyltransferase 87 family protein [Runella limosa]